MNVPFQICSFIDVVCELVADFSCFFAICLVYCFDLTAFCMWFNKGQAAWFSSSSTIGQQAKTVLDHRAKLSQRAKSSKI